MMMKILLTFDDFYAPHAAVVMESILEHASRKPGFIIMYFDDGLTPGVIQTLRNHYSGRTASLEFCPVNREEKQLFANLKHAEYTTVNTFLRLFAPAVLKNEDVLLYLDSDLIVMDDIEKLTRRADPRYAINAVAEYFPSPGISALIEKADRSDKEESSIRQAKAQGEKNKMLGMKENSPYFNAGVVIMNLAMLRRGGGRPC